MFQMQVHHLYESPLPNLVDREGRTSVNRNIRVTAVINQKDVPMCNVISFTIEIVTRRTEDSNE